MKVKNRKNVHLPLLKVHRWISGIERKNFADRAHSPNLDGCFKSGFIKNYENETKNANSILIHSGSVCGFFLYIFRAIN